MTRAWSEAVRFKMKRRTNHKQNVDLSFLINATDVTVEGLMIDRNFWALTILLGAPKSNAERTLKKKDSIGDKRKKEKKKTVH